MDKRRAMTRSGAAAESLPVCKYFEVMRFLHEKTSNLPTHSNIELGDIHVRETAPEEHVEFPSLLSPSQPQDISTSLITPLPTSRSSSLSSPPTSRRPSLEESASKRLKRKTISEESAPDPFLQYIQKMDNQMLNIVDKNKETDNDEATVFFMSLIPVLKDFNKNKLRLTKIKIQQLLYDIEFGDE